MSSRRPGMDTRPALPDSGSAAGAGGNVRAGHTVKSESRLLLAAVLTTTMLVAEGIGGLISGSLALLADAGHMLVDASALVLAWLGARFSRRPADSLRSFGYRRLEVLASFVNALSMFVLVGWIVWEAIERIRDPAPILSGVMLAVAVTGLAVNLVVLRVLGPHHGRDHAASGSGHDHDHAHGAIPAHDHHPHAARSQSLSGDHEVDLAIERRDPPEDLNIGGARLHVIGDLLGSLAAVAAALIIRYTGWTIADPILSVLVSLLILASAWRLLRRSTHILLEGVPEGIDLAGLTRAMADAHPDIRDVHHVHVWMLGSGARMATLHLRFDEGAASMVAQTRVRELLRGRFDIDHVTIQVDSMPCVDQGCGAQD
jgi:cobalt-zinc-cadmium efflux system protein